jgi:hypothetical protein
MIMKPKMMMNHGLIPEDEEKYKQYDAECPSYSALLESQEKNEHIVNRLKSCDLKSYKINDDSTKEMFDKAAIGMLLNVMYTKYLAKVNENNILSYGNPLAAPKKVTDLHKRAVRSLKELLTISNECELGQHVNQTLESFYENQQHQDTDDNDINLKFSWSFYGKQQCQDTNDNDVNSVNLNWSPSMPYEPTGTCL